MIEQSRSDLLRSHIEAAKGPPVIGVDDCGPWVAAWVRLVTGKDVAFPAYSTREQGHAMAAAAGGLVAFVDPLMVAAGLHETVYPQVGDVCVIGLADRETAAIFCGSDHVIVRGELAGANFLRRRNVLKAWSLP